MTSPSISKIVCDKKTWRSEGAVRHSDFTMAREEYYPKIGVAFIATKSNTNVPIPPAGQDIYKWVKQSDGSYKQEGPLEVPELNIATVNFTIDQSDVPATHPGTGKPLKPFPQDFVNAYKNLNFYEQGDVLVSQPLAIPGLVDNGKPVLVSYVVSIHVDNTGRAYMLQRSFWNGSYIGTYCCG